MDFFHFFSGAKLFSYWCSKHRIHWRMFLTGSLLSSHNLLSWGRSRCCHYYSDKGHSWRRRLWKAIKLKLNWYIRPTFSFWLSQCIRLERDYFPTEIGRLDSIKHIIKTFPPSWEMKLTKYSLGKGGKDTFKFKWEETYIFLHPWVY